VLFCCIVGYVCVCVVEALIELNVRFLFFVVVSCLCCICWLCVCAMCVLCVLCVFRCGSLW